QRLQRIAPRLSGRRFGRHAILPNARRGWVRETRSMPGGRTWHKRRPWLRGKLVARSPWMTIISAWASAGVVGGTFLALLWLEHAAPPRRRVERPRPRLARNLVVATTNLVAVRLVELPAILPLTVHVERGGWGLLGHVALPAWLAVPVALLLLDYTLYIWH